MNSQTFNVGERMTIFTVVNRTLKYAQVISSLITNLIFIEDGRVLLVLNGILSFLKFRTKVFK